MNKQPYTWGAIEYLEKPITSDEKAIASVLEEMRMAIVSHHPEILASAVSEDAVLVLSKKNRKRITKAEYLEGVKKNSAVVKEMKYKNVLIRMNGDSSATVSLVRYIQAKNFLEELVNRSFEFRKIDGTWKITKAIFY